MSHDEHVVHLLRWPCGCVADGTVEPICALWSVAYECSWCGATFSLAEFRKGFAEGSADEIHLQEVPSLLLVGEQIVEVGDDCSGCKIPLVREFPRRDGRWKHLLVPFSAVAVLRN